MKGWLFIISMICCSLSFEAKGWRFFEIDDQLNLLDAERNKVRLAGIQILQETEARTLLMEFKGQDFQVDFENTRFDRWGNRLAEPRFLDGSDIQDLLLRRGLALCRPEKNHPCSENRLAVERQARSARRGIWAQNWPFNIDEVSSKLGQFLLVEGRILHAQATRRYVYLNFGEVWKTDFTIRVPAKAAKKMAKAGLDLVALEGRFVEVRGMVFEENGPMIEMLSPTALELVE